MCWLHTTNAAFLRILIVKLKNEELGKEVGREIILF